MDLMPSDHGMLQALERASSAARPGADGGEAIAYPHLRERGTATTIEDEFVGKFEVPGFPLRFSAFPEVLQLPAPTLGQHNAEVLREYGDYSADRIERLQADGILHQGRIDSSVLSWVWGRYLI